jgi:catechol 2,3-dioxygenase-like lactoylglutathione lyase family enzyme
MLRSLEEGVEMEHIITNLLRNFEEGKINRRQLVRSLTVAASAAAAVGVTPSAFADEGTLKTIGINHISYRVANYGKSRDFYSGLLGLKVSNDSGTKCRLTVGDIGIVVQPGENEVTRRTPMIDHIAYTVDASMDQIRAAVKRRGVTAEHGLNHPPSKTASSTPEGGVQVKDPDGFHVTLVPKK